MADKPGPRLQMNMGQGQFARLEQRLVMTPPVAGSEAEVNSHAQNQAVSVRQVNPNVLEAVNSYVSTENQRNPYTDKQIHGYLEEQGLDSNRADIALARSQLGIATSSQRKRQYLDS
jgi:hypothetical protein